ncbi:hypothetical protein Poli38472_007157 [Pythium oligandrum]|uniref:Ankyrin repeat protein n=1 Tax=Pythium oligandrum TaxID=41045 RepID=A0A8K1FGS6_PYTOL|nr:hypothetical protein Poli38472_007157 [Pythium oligandrum]|eukprot:TMW59012.1 hypothetical protein Poli38472_007157 [Pythium oligandrum]
METSSVKRVNDNAVEADATHVTMTREALETREEEEATVACVRVDQGDTADLIERQAKASEERGGEEELRLAVERCDFERARDLHGVLSRDPLLRCDGEAMKKAIEIGETEFVTWHLEHCSVNEVSRLMPVAAAYGQVGILERLWPSESGSVREEVAQASVLAAVRGGSLEAVRWFDEKMSCAWPSDALDVASEPGHLSVVQWLHANRSEGCTTGAMDWAARNGHLDVVQWLHANRSEGCTSKAMVWAAEDGHLDVVQWLHANRSEGCSTGAMNGAAEDGHLDVVQWLHANRSEGCTTNAMDGASQSGYSAVVQWLHANRSEGCTSKAMVWAAENGHFEVLEWLVRNRSETKSPDNILCHAIKHRQLRVVKALLDRDEMRSWPQPDHADILFDLFRSKNTIDASILEHIVSTRHQRYRPDAADNPYAEYEADADADADELGSDSILLTSVSKICERHNVPNSCGHIITDFAFGDDSTRMLSHEMHWLFGSSRRSSRDAVLLAEGGDLARARWLPNRLKRTDHLHCSKRFLYLTVACGELDFVKWHMLKCNVHSLVEWLCVAVWVGRMDVIEWMRDLEDRPGVNDISGELAS